MMIIKRYKLKHPHVEWKGPGRVVDTANKDGTGEHGPIYKRYNSISTLVALSH